MATGMVITAWTLAQQASFTLDTSIAFFAWNGLLQGVAMGLVFAPLNTLAYATLDPIHRAEGTALFSLLRNVGSSIGVAITFALLDRGAQVNHAVLAEHVNPFNPALSQYLNAGNGLLGASGLAMIDGEITRQATLISMLSDFRLMAALVLLTTPVVFMFNRPERSRAPQAQPILE
jgi:DHA2 family multidrug resistance protein